MRFDELDLGTRLLPYEPTWQLQREVHAAVADGSREDVVLLCEHEGVYTAGKRTAKADRPVDGTPVVDVDRGGRITWHGPGQLVGYPIVRLAAPIDVVRYVRALEEALIRTCADLGLTTIRVEGRSGVWFAATTTQRERKVAAIGVRVSRGVTMHGFALNCEPRPVGVRPHRALRDPRRGRDVPVRGGRTTRDDRRGHAAGTHASGRYPGAAPGPLRPHGVTSPSPGRRPAARGLV